MTCILIPDPYLPGEHRRPSGGLHYLIGVHGQGTTTAVMHWAVTAAATGVDVIVYDDQEHPHQTETRLANADAGRPTWATDTPAVPSHGRYPRVSGVGWEAAPTARNRTDRARSAVLAGPPGGWVAIDNADGLDPHDLRAAARHNDVSVLAVLHVPTVYDQDTDMVEAMGEDQRAAADTITGVRRGEEPGTLLLVPFKDRHRYPVVGAAVVDAHSGCR